VPFFFYWGLGGLFFVLVFLGRQIFALGVSTGVWLPGEAEEDREREKQRGGMNLRQKEKKKMGCDVREVVILGIWHGCQPSSCFWWMQSPDFDLQSGRAHHFTSTSTPAALDWVCQCQSACAWHGVPGSLLSWLPLGFPSAAVQLLSHDTPRSFWDYHPCARCIVWP
jgi:hypothetical protein